MCTPQDVLNCKDYRKTNPNLRVGMCPPDCPDLSRFIVIGKQNSKEKPCQYCGSITTCDCPIMIYTLNKNYSSEMLKIKQKCPHCGKEI